MNFITINTPKIQGALFTAKEPATMKVYGQESNVIMTGWIKSGDEKNDDGGYTPMAYGSLNVRAALAKTKAGKDYMFLSVDGGLQGRLNRAEDGKEYDYIGDIDAGDGKTFTVFGRKKTSEGGVKYVSISSAEKAEKSDEHKAESKPAAQSITDDDIPF